ncbi:MAG: helix-turn-helix domain-containing protein [Solobacterium sp.]|nr:helix-turn-helix domain-containing protein [Solobacterium sp.]
MELKDIIQMYQKKTGISDSEIARRLQVARSTVVRWSTGDIKTVSPEIGRRLSDLVGYDVPQLLKGIPVSGRLPILGYVKGGYDMFAQENYLGEESVPLEDSQKGDYFLKVEGNSMNGLGIMDGSLVLVHKTDVVESGEIAVVMVGDEVTVKRVILRRGMMALEAANPAVENRYFSAREVHDLPVRIIGRVLYVKTYF